MNRYRASRAKDASRIAGFSLVEALVAIALTGVIACALGAVTAQWLPNWHRGFARVQRTELLSLGLERLVADLAAAEFVPPNGETKQPLFEGSALSVTLVRTALGPNVSPHLEVVRLAETVDERGFALVRTRAPFAPLAVDRSDGVDQIGFADPVVLIRAPFRISFSYAGQDRIWRDSWRGDAQLPIAIRVTVREAATDQVLSVSTATLVHATISADCIQQKSTADCAKSRQAQPTAAAPAPAAQEL